MFQGVNDPNANSDELKNFLSKKRKNPKAEYTKSNINLKNLKHFNLENRSLNNYSLVKILFYLRSIESLILSKDNLNFDYSCFNPKESNLKRLEI